MWNKLASGWKALWIYVHIILETDVRAYDDPFWLLGCSPAPETRKMLKAGRTRALGKSKTRKIKPMRHGLGI